MSTSIYQSAELLVTRMAGNCERCGTRGRCVQFGMPIYEGGASDCLTATLCLPCFELIVEHVRAGTEVRDT